MYTLASESSEDLNLFHGDEETKVSKCIVMFYDNNIFPFLESVQKVFR